MQTPRFHSYTRRPKEKKAVVIQKGKGTPLGEMHHVKSQLEKLKKNDMKELKDVHRLLFGTPGSAHNIRMHIRQFSGFVFEVRGLILSVSLSLTLTLSHEDDL